MPLANSKIWIKSSSSNKFAVGLFGYDKNITAGSSCLIAAFIADIFKLKSSLSGTPVKGKPREFAMCWYITKLGVGAMTALRSFIAIKISCISSSEPLPSTTPNSAGTSKQSRNPVINSLADGSGYLLGSTFESSCNHSSFIALGHGNGFSIASNLISPVASGT